MRAHRHSRRSPYDAAKSRLSILAGRLQPNYDCETRSRPGACQTSRAAAGVRRARACAAKTQETTAARARPTFRVLARSTSNAETFWPTPPAVLALISPGLLHSSPRVAANLVATVLPASSGTKTIDAASHRK